MKRFIIFLFLFVFVHSTNVPYNVENILQSRDPAILNNCTIPKISKRVTFIFAVIPFTGTLAIDRFYSKWTDIGAIKLVLGLCCDLFTCGLFSIIFWLVDWISLLQSSGMYKTDGDGCPFLTDF